MLGRMVFAVSLLSAAFIISSPGIGQVTTATLTGVVTDETGAVVPGAQVTVTDTATGARRLVTADGAGRFQAPQLPPGPYEVIVTLPGFETLVRRGITLAIGQEANLTLAMKVGAVTEQVTVTGEAPIVDTSTSSVSGVVEEKRIEELPLNGRDFSQLPLVQPGVYAIRNSDPTVTNKGFGTRVSMGGSRPDQTAWLLDGTNIKSMTNFGTPGSAAGLMLGVDAVREFQVLTSNYSAEFGRAAGGVINMVSKSGTNQLHGSAYEFLRNSALDARNFFDQDKAAFKRNQFGGSFGGPIKKDKTFFFGNYEGMRQRLGLTNLALVPDANVHRGLIPAPGGGAQQVAIAPAILPYLNLWPLPNGPAIGGGLADLYAPASNSVNEDFFVIRADHHINDAQSLFSRFTFDQGNLVQPDPVPITNVLVNAHSRYATVQYQNIISPQFLMTSQIAYNRTLVGSNIGTTIDYPARLDLILPGVPPQLNFPGATPFGPTTQNLFRSVQNLYEFMESGHYAHGRHSLKFGADIEKIGYNRFERPSGSNGTYTWNSLADFVADNRLAAFAAAAPGSDTTRSWSWLVFGTYFQDDLKLGRNLTLNLGVRYEPMTVPTEKHGRVSNIPDWVTATSFQTNVGLFQNPTKKNISPRVGFAWDPMGDGRTSVRGGFGIFFLDYHGAYIGTPGSKNPPFAASTANVLGNLGSSAADLARITPALLNAALSPNVLPELIAYHLKPSYEMKVNLTVERQLRRDLSVAVGYLGDRGVHLWRFVDINDPTAITVNGRPFVVNGAPRVNPRFGAGSVRNSDAQSFYNALKIELKKRFSHGLQLQGSYTWSKNIDDSTTGIASTDYIAGGNGPTSQPYNPKADRGLSSLHMGQNLVLNGLYAFPQPAHAGFSSVLLEGWQVASIFTAGAGVPFSVYVSGRNAPDLSRFTGVQHPDLVAGRSFGGIVIGDPNQYFDPKAFILPLPAPPGFPAGSGFYGNAGRNFLLGPGLVNLDFSLQKNTPVRIREGSRLEFHADFFNLFNRANFGVPSSVQVLNPSSGQYIAGAGKITRTVTSSRELQFGLKLIF